MFLRRRGHRVVVLNTGARKDIREPDLINVPSAGALLGLLLRGPAALLHVHVSFADDLGKLAPVCLAAAARRVPWLVTLHSGNSPRCFAALPAPRRRVATAILRRAHTVVCVNASIRDGFSQVVAPKRLAVVSPFHVDVAEAPLPDALAQFVSARRPLLTCVGLYEPTYGFDKAIELMAVLRRSMPEAGLVLVGDLKRADPFRDAIRRAQLDGHVMLSGNLSHGQCIRLMRQSSLFLRPTLYDGDSLSVREALALGIPVLATPTDFRPAGVTLFDPNNAADLTAKALALLASGAAGGTRTEAGEEENFEALRRLYLQALPPAA
jgi:glycogen(starch) synthase